MFKKSLRKTLKDYVNRGVSIKVIRKPPELHAIQWKGNNREQLEKLMHYLVPGRFIIEDLDIGDWIVVHENGMYEVVSDKEFGVIFERVRVGLNDSANLNALRGIFHS